MKSCIESKPAPRRQTTFPVGDTEKAVLASVRELYQCNRAAALDIIFDAVAGLPVRPVVVPGVQTPAELARLELHFRELLEVLDSMTPRLNSPLPSSEDPYLMAKHRATRDNARATLARVRQFVMDMEKVCDSITPNLDLDWTRLREVGTHWAKVIGDERATIAAPIAVGGANR